LLFCLLSEFPPLSGHCHRREEKDGREKAGQSFNSVWERQGLVESSQDYQDDIKMPSGF